MDAFVDERDFQLLEGDKYTFAVLRAIVGGKNMLLLSLSLFSRKPSWMTTIIIRSRLMLPCGCLSR